MLNGPRLRGQLNAIRQGHAAESPEVVQGICREEQYDLEHTLDDTAHALIAVAGRCDGLERHVKDLQSQLDAITASSPSEPSKPRPATRPSSVKLPA